MLVQEEMEAMKTRKLWGVPAVLMLITSLLLAAPGASGPVAAQGESAPRFDAPNGTFDLTPFTTLSAAARYFSLVSDMNYFSPYFLRFFQNPYF